MPAGTRLKGATLKLETYSRNRKVVKILHYERGFYVLYEKRPVMGRFKKPVFDEVSKCYRIQWSDMAYLTESIVVDKMYVSPKD